MEIEKESAIQKKDVLMVNYTGKAAGSIAYEMTKALLNIGIPIVALISSDVDNRSSWDTLPLEKLVVIDTYKSVKEYIVNSIRFSFRKNEIKQSLEKYNIKDIYCPMYCLWNPMILKIFPSAKHILVVHDPKDHAGEKVKNILSGINYKNYDLLYVHSKKFVEFVKAKYKKPVFYMPLGRYNLYKECNDKRKIVDYSPNKINFLFFGRILKYKGLDLLLDAYLEINKSTEYEISLTIVGDGDITPYKKEINNAPNLTVINRWIENNEVESVFTGKNIICVMPYKEATQSGVVLVAMDYGATVIAANAGGIDEQIEDRKTGLLFEAGNKIDLIKKMTEVICDKDLRNRLSANAMSFIKTLTWEQSAQILCETAEINYRND